jgi:hypothetical protein
MKSKRNRRENFKLPWKLQNKDIGHELNRKENDELETDNTTEQMAKTKLISAYQE